MSNAEHDEDALTEALAENFRDTADDAFTIRAIARRYAEHYARQASGWISVADEMPEAENGEWRSVFAAFRSADGMPAFTCVADAYDVAHSSPEHGELIAWREIEPPDAPEGDELARLIERADEGGAR